ncbi:MAG: tRNA lysidine(34) synthetase TilS [Chlorobiaceae bacterium]|nr:tRNA lysidine(34) synthetase TilS [Chlorobiaceae bacterium]
MNQLEKKFLGQLKTRKLVARGDNVLAAVSGGPDSIAMLLLLHAVKPAFHFELAAAHCNFSLRGRESDDDERFVTEFCSSLDVPCSTVRFDTGLAAAEMKKSIEESARILRYRYFESLAAQKGFTRIATGHHVSDNAETLLFNLFRGVSLPGLVGIREHNGRIIRPMLLFHKEDIRSYLREKGVDAREDSSNALDEYDRNFIRNRVIPLIEERFASKLLPSLSRLSVQAGELEEFLELHFEELARREPGLVLQDNQLEVPALKKLTVFEQKEIFKRALRELGAPVDAQTLQKLAALLQSSSGKTALAGRKLSVRWKGGRLHFTMDKT